jgi:predicted patatin/cPLA2 family phospholipase
MNAFRLVVVGATVAVLAACAGPVRKGAVPEDLTTKAIVPGMPDVRYRAGIDREAVMREGIESVRREQAYLASRGHTGPMPPAYFLAVSGGGDNGAFGAGLLNGWTAAGDRPEFKLVTGVSTGALIAPFAFLGPSHDAALKHFYTTVTPKDILEARSIVTAIFSDAAADNTPLWRLVSKQIDRAFLDAVAAEYQKGRLLLIATTDLDARQAVIWNMTKIAASKDPKALELFRSIMIASAAIPGAFPPVMIDVEANGQRYQEMHVDGGTVSQVFVYPPSLHVKEVLQQHRETRKRVIYIIRNDRVDPDWADTERRMLPIAGRAISSLIHTQGIGDLYTIYATTQRDGAEFNLAIIPDTFNAPHEEEFDTRYMRALFQTGYDMAAKGFPWRKVPPGY